MNRLLACCLLSLAPGVDAGEAPPSPVAWSPDGRWLAFTEEIPEGGSGGIDLLFPGGEAREADGGGSTFRLWAVRADDRAAVLLDESARGIGPPSWRPDGEAIAYCRAAGGGWYEAVVREGVAKVRVIGRFPAPADGGSPALSVAWSAALDRLAVERPNPAGLALLDAASGKELAFIPGGALPAWHPNGREIAYFRREEPASALACRADSDGKNERVLTHVAPPAQAPVWALGGRSLLVVDCPRSPDGSAQAVLLDLGRPEGRPVPLKAIENPLLPTQRLAGCWLAVDEAGMHQYYSVLVEGRPNAISHHAGAVVLDRFAPLDEAVPMSSLALDPRGSRLAVRAGDPGPRGSVVLVGLTDRKATPVLPGPGARSAWRQLLLRTLLRALPDVADGEAELLDARPKDFRSLPTVLPVVADGEAGPRLPPDVGKLAEAIAAAGAEGPATAAPTLDDRLAAFVVAYTRGEYAEALRLLEPVESAVRDPDRRLRLLGLRAQVEAMAGQRQAAAGRLEYLTEILPAAPEAFPGEGTAFDVISGGQEHAGWVRSLKSRFLEDRAPSTTPAHSPRDVPGVPRT